MISSHKLLPIIKDSIERNKVLIFLASKTLLMNKLQMGKRSILIIKQLKTMETSYNGINELEGQIE